MRAFQAASALILMVFSTIAFGKEPVKTIEVFSTTESILFQIQAQKKLRRPYKIVFHDLNAVAQFEERMSEGLPGTEAAAKKALDEKVRLMGGDAELERQVTQAYEPLTRSIELGLLEYPAVVINSHYVVLGSDNVELAIREFRQWEEKQE